MKIILRLAFLLIIFYSANTFSQVKSIDSERLVKMMEGSFSSEEQSKNDSDYLDIRLHMKRIWTDRTDGKWLYVEQASASAVNKPYRQRVYRITNTYEGRFESTVFTINDPLRFTGEWKNEHALSGLTPDSLSIREGCAVILTLMNDGGYEGGTKGKKCLSELRGAKYATSEVNLSQEGILSWDRGFDENDIQVWGAVKGGYFFKRLEQ
ncbi:MAG: chromophore lyase CpcT/CpeT [Ignavibacteria bacterium]